MRKKANKILFIAFILIINIYLVSCNINESLEREDSIETCNQIPFKTGITLEIPIIPISIQIDSSGLDFKIQGNLNIDLFIFELEPYLSFESEGNPVSSCLKVEIYNPEWESNYRRFYVNFDNYHTFRVIVKTQEYTEFIFNKEKWAVSNLGDVSFLDYQYRNNTLFIDTTKADIREITIIPEDTNNLEQFFFCSHSILDKLSDSNPFPSFYKLAISLFQDIATMTREIIISHFGQIIGCSPLLFIIAFYIIYIIRTFALQPNNIKTFIIHLILLVLLIIFYLSIRFPSDRCWI